MPGKRHGKGRRPPPGKRRVESKYQPAAVAQQPAVQSPQPASPAEKVTPRASAPVPTAKPATYPHVRTELVRIAVLTTVILVILFVLARTLPRV